jgi:RNA polymerase sigma-70 factor (ECF subfamily)
MDAVQTVMMRMVESKSRYNGLSKEELRFIMYKSVKNVFIDELKYKERNRRDTRKMSTADVSEFKNIGILPTAESTLFQQDVDEAMTRLSLRIRFSIHLWILGFSYKEIAEIMGAPIGTVKGRIFYARGHLTKYLHL